MIDTGLLRRVAVVTGANHGIGSATARALAAEGARVLVTYLRLPLEEALARRAAAGESDTPGEVQYTVHRAGSADAVVAAIRAAGGLAEEIADMILFLASDQARWVTGQLVYVGAGHVMPL